MRNVRKARRSLLSGLGVAAVGVALGSRPLAAQTASGGRFQPARHQQDGWLDAVAGKHRTFIDASTPKGAGEALLYANNLYEANKSGYTLPEADIVVVACMRHFATPFAYNDAIWKKYGKNFSMMIEFTDPKTKQAPSTNVLNSAAYGMALSNFETRSIRWSSAERGLPCATWRRISSRWSSPRQPKGTPMPSTKSLSRTRFRTATWWPPASSR
jgi:hypothetical protein